MLWFILLSIFFAQDDDFDIFSLPSVESTNIVEESEEYKQYKESQTVTETKYFQTVLKTSAEPIMKYLEYLTFPRLVFLEQLFPDYPYAHPIEEDLIWLFDQYIKVSYRSDGRILVEENYQKESNSNEYQLIQKSEFFYHDPLFGNVEKTQLRSIKTKYRIQVFGNVSEIDVTTRINKFGKPNWEIFKNGNQPIWYTKFEYGPQGTLRQISRFDGQLQNNGTWGYFAQNGTQRKEEVWSHGTLIKHWVSEGLNFRYYNQNGDSISKDLYYNISNQEGEGV